MICLRVLAQFRVLAVPTGALPSSHGRREGHAGAE